MGTLLTLLSLMLLGVLPVLAGYLIIEPIHKRARSQTAFVRRFTILDFFALMVQIQVVVVVGLAVHSWEPYGPLISLVAIAGNAALWWAGVEAAARLGIVDAKRRLAIHLLLLPGTVGTMILAALSVMAVGDAFFSLRGGLSRFADSRSGPWETAFVVLVLLIATSLLRMLSRWIARQPGERFL